MSPRARIDDAKLTDMVREWQILARRFIGTPWAVSIADQASPLANLDIEALTPDDFVSMASFDKVWVMRIDASGVGSGLVFVGREFDAATKQVGPLQVRQVAALADAARAMLQFSRDLFNPTALITGQEGGRALLTVQGAMIEPASPVGAVVDKGTVFLPLRLVSRADDKVQIMKIKHTYLQVESIDGPVARCAIISGLRDPLSKRMARPNSLAALGLKPGNSPIKLRFVTGADRAGRIVLKPGFARGLVILRLLAGSVEPIVELPIMPGESADELLISVDLKALTVALEAQLDSLRDEVIDLVALRARSESRMKARLESEDWAGLDEELKEFTRLTPRDQLARRLAELKDAAAHRQADLKTAILTKTAQAQITELQAMIDRYMDDDAFTAYSEALAKARADAADKAKGQAKKKTAGPAVRVPPAAAPKDEGAEPKAPAAGPVRGQPKGKAAPPSTTNEPF
jgi:hypothetical protein